jgi:aldehyde dehydrogenase (NAD+)
MEFLKALNLKATNTGVSTGSKWYKTKLPSIDSYSPVDGKKIGSVSVTDEATYQLVVSKAEEAFKEWRTWPAPKRGEVVRQIGDELRKYKESLGKLVSYEMGKSLQEGLG